jgi:hypothetical protein
MKRICYIFIFNILTIQNFAQRIDILIIAENQPAQGVCIYVNGKLKTITGEQGNARVGNIKVGDTIRTSYLGYKPETVILSPQHTALNLNLTYDVRKLGEVEVLPKNDMPIFMQMLKWGTQVALLQKETSFSIIDTLAFADDTVVYRRITGKYKRPLRGYRAIKPKLSTAIEILGTVGISKDDHIFQHKNEKEKGGKLFENYEIPLKDIYLCFTTVEELSDFDKGYMLTYLGKDSNKYERFYFYMSNSDWRFGYGMYKVYFGGIVYLNDKGIIEKIRQHKTSLDPSVESYEFDIDYSYDEKKNVVMPYQAVIRTYKVDKVLNVVLTRRARLEIYY